ncbi:Transcriptional regulator [Candidatus Desulfarcum epimagneticum]|uniref:siroheme decarboxylase n=1 Tax=uncultured Desulfobacteraceae bacterium TaxID=218296 RepID=A0A484HER9_9BACT|nr:Transcriptional regulator [uncultured Desulfobacteraceae bacterium]
MEAKLDDTDKRIINRIQSDLPIAPRPYLAVAEELGLEEDDVIRRIRRLKKNGIIRRIGGNFVPEKLNFSSTLCAARVPGEQVESFAREVSRYPGVTHNYLRENDYNVWFTFIAPSMAHIEQNLKSISEKTGIRDILNLPATRVFKIKAHFTL